MVQKSKKKSSFRGKVASNAQRTSKDGNAFGYLKLPKGIPMLTPDPEGSIKLDFIPYVVTDSKHPDRDAETETAIKGSIWWRRPFSVHRNVGVDGDTELCLKSFGQKCPICEFRAKRKADGATNEELKAYNSSMRNLYLVIPKGSKKFEEKLHIFDISDFLFQELLTKELKEDPDKEIFPELEGGLTLKVRFEPGTFVTKNPYPEASRIDFLERDEDYDESLLDTVPSLDDIFSKKSYEELKSKFMEGDTATHNDDDEDMEEIEEEEDEEIKPRAKKSIRKPVVEEDEDEEDEDDEEVPVPKKKKPVVVEEKEEEDEPEDEEDIPAPRKKKKPVVVEDEEEEEEVTVPKRKPVAKKKEKLVCPHGLKFGIDTEQYDVCDTCDIWSECVAEHEKN